MIGGAKVDGERIRSANPDCASTAIEQMLKGLAPDDWQSKSEGTPWMHE